MNLLSFKSGGKIYNLNNLFPRQAVKPFQNIVKGSARFEVF